MKRLFALTVAMLASVAFADEGMWTFNNFPSQKVKEKYGFAPTQEWLDHVRLSSARLAGGCSASFVSDGGLVMTNHHCARGCIDKVSTAKRDFIKNGFYAKTQAEELKCPAVEVNKLLQIIDVTDQVHKALANLTGEKREAAEKQIKAKLEKDCGEGDKFRCDLVRLYTGGVFNLYKYQRFQDVRLVFAPEHAIAFFGGDPDNFEFPRYDLDVSFFRVYEDGKPAKIDHFFKWSQAGAKGHELTFVSGNPGNTSRLDTVAQLTYARDYQIPERLFWLSELRGMVNEFQTRGAEQTRISNNFKFGIENSVKALKGRREALVDEKFFNSLVAQEKALRDRVNADATLKKEVGAAWDNIDKALDDLRAIRQRMFILEGAAGGGSDLFRIAKHLYRVGTELQKPSGERLDEYADARLKFLKLTLFSPAPIYPQVDQMQLAFYLTKLREVLGPDDPVVKQVLGKDTPEEVAARAVRGTKLANVKARQALFDGGQKAVTSSSDPMVKLVASLDDAARAVRKQYEDQIESVIKTNEEAIARARFKLYGTNTYPDATFSLRLSYGAVEGYTQADGQKIEPITYMKGTFEHATGKEPFALPKSWLRAEKKLNGDTPMDFVTTNDIIGGNSGSPVVNKDAEIVGLVFDGNIESLGGEYGFDASVNRTVAVHSAALIEALDKVYNAQRLLKELRPEGTQAPGGK